MGGDRNKDIKYNNAAQEKENLQRQKENDRASLLNEEKIRTFEYEGGMESAMQKAELDAAAGVTAQRTKAISDSSKLLTDFESQEKRRMLRAKKGTGQVRGQDTSITGEMTDEARSLLNRGSDYWDTKRGDARSKAAAAAKAAYLKKHGTLEGFVAGGDLSTAARGRGNEYQGSGTSKQSNQNLLATGEQGQTYSTYTQDEAAPIGAKKKKNDPKYGSGY